MNKKEVLELFKECSVENKHALNETETAYFWLRTGLIGWSIKKELDRDSVYTVYLNALANHKKIMLLIEKKDKKLLLHNLQVGITEKDLDEIMLHLYNK